MLKRVDVAVYNVIKDTMNNFKGGIHLFGLRITELVLQITIDAWSPRKWNPLLQYRQKIIDGDLIVAEK